MRTASAHSSKRNLPPPRKAPRPGTKLRELWDLLHVYRGEVLAINMQKQFHRVAWQSLQDFYGLDIRRLGYVRIPGGGRGDKMGRYVLAGEWFGSKYHDYVAERLARLEGKKK